MGLGYRKRHKNVYFETRKYASECNEELSSREKTAELLEISPSTLAEYELGRTKVVPPDRVKAMSDLYNAPELMNWYCKHECPIGYGRGLIDDAEPIEKAVIRLLVAVHEAKDYRLLDRLVKIAESNCFDAYDLDEIVSILEDIEYAVNGVKLIGTKKMRCSDDGQKEDREDTS